MDILQVFRPKTVRRSKYSVHRVKGRAVDKKSRLEFFLHSGGVLR